MFDPLFYTGCKKRGIGKTTEYFHEVEIHGTHGTQGYYIVQKPTRQ
jgi:hypothetical protein